MIDNFENYKFDLDKIEIQWKMEPFPHAIVDNFLPQDLFNRISSFKPSQLKTLKRSNKTSLEFNKKEFGLGEKHSAFLLPIKLMGLSSGKFLFKDFLDPEKIKTLAEFDNWAGYYPYHSSSRKGLLGAHVDHSNLNKDIHFANSIYYVHPEWKTKWGGETILFNKFGIIKKILIEPVPNRLILFIHSNISFHGVNRILCPNNITRNTYYMDYYMSRSYVTLLNENLLKLGNRKKLHFTYHPTTFIPFFPLGLTSFSLGKTRDNIKYLRSYFIYILFLFKPFTYIRFLLFNQIRLVKKIFFKKK